MNIIVLVRITEIPVQVTIFLVSVKLGPVDQGAHRPGVRYPGDCVGRGVELDVSKALREALAGGVYPAVHDYWGNRSSRIGGLSMQTIQTGFWQATQKTWLT